MQGVSSPGLFCAIIGERAAGPGGKEAARMEQIIIHVDMDAFYAAVEIRDNPALRGKPLIIGSLPQERGVVATASYEARKYGIHSAMNIKEAYRLCPAGVYMHPNFEKYRAVSARLHEIWNAYASAAETVALDEAYLDVTSTAGSWERARLFAREIKRRTREELGLTCSVGLAYSKTAAKTASEEKKPDGYFGIPTAQDFVRLIEERDVRVLLTVGEKTAEKLRRAGIRTVRDVQAKQTEVIRLLGRQGMWLARLAYGEDQRRVTPYNPQDAKTIGREITLQENVEDRDFLKEVLLLLALSVERRAQSVGLYGEGVTLKITYGDMKSITRSKMTASTRSAWAIYWEAARLLDQTPLRPIRLIGVSLSHLSGEDSRQLRFEDVYSDMAGEDAARISAALQAMQQRYGLDFAGKLEAVFRADTLHRTVEYMRRHRNGA